ncbi:MAG: sn-glycerol-3-phosphate ABC transporter substrate-binding protein, partial [Ensifer adhaerens]
MRVLKWTLAATSAISIFAASNAFAATELAWWHAMTGANNETVERLAKEFNESQSEYKIVPV